MYRIMFNFPNYRPQPLLSQSASSGVNFHWLRTRKTWVGFIRRKGTANEMPLCH